MLFESEKGRGDSLALSSPNKDLPGSLHHEEPFAGDVTMRKQSVLWTNLPDVESYAAPPLRLINLVDSEGDTPLHTAVRSGDLVGISVSEGAEFIRQQLSLFLINGHFSSNCDPFKTSKHQ